MKHRLFLRFHGLLHQWRFVLPEELLALLLVLFVFVAPVDASTRFQERSLLVYDANPGVTTDYELSLRYMTPASVGSFDMLFCINPIPYEPCVTPPGLDVSGATLVEQTGETGYTILSKSTNHITLTRAPSMVTSGDKSTYKFTNIVNPSDTNEAFSIRLKSLASTDGSGPQIDFGSVRSKITESIVIETQVPPMLIFCFARQVEYNCTGTDDTYYTDMGELTADDTLTAQSQMAVGTNASAGFVITANGTPPAAGTNVVDSLQSPTISQPGKTQFGMNLVANTDPAVGEDPEGVWANAVAAPGYNVPNHYKYVPGDTVAYSENVSLMKKFTVSYIFNTSPNLRAGVYTTTITYIASGRF
ncbi:MAG: hypothetical protein WBP12_00895 [Candidatus Saccharimonas sp.]